MPRPSDLEAWLDEALPPADMARVEKDLRKDKALLADLSAINARRDAGVHTLAEIWRRHRLTCPSRERLGGFLLGTLPDEASDYIRFHVETIGCRYCLANLSDLGNQQRESADASAARRRKYFQSSAGYLRAK